MITVYIWKAQGESVGHASAKIDQEGSDDGYVSWWPGDANKGSLKKQNGNPNSYEGDKAAEGRPADQTRNITGLADADGLKWWRDFKKGGFYQADSQNCSWVVIQMLKAAGGDAFVSILSDWRKDYSYIKDLPFFSTLDATLGVVRFVRALIPDGNNGEDILAYADNHMRNVIVPEDCIRYADAIILGRIKQAAKQAGTQASKRPSKLSARKPNDQASRRPDKQTVR